MRPAVKRQVRQYLPDNARELKSVSGTWAGEDRFLRARLEIEDEMTIWSVRVKTDRSAQEFTVRLWQVTLQQFSH